MEEATYKLALAFMGLALLLAKPRLCFALLFLICPIVNPSARVTSVRIYLNNLSILLIFFSLLVQTIAQRRHHLRWSKQDGAIVLLFICFLLSAIVGGNNTSTIKKLMALSLFFMGYSVIKLSIGNREKIRELAFYLAISAVIASLSGLYSYFFVPFRGAIDRAAGAFGNPNSLANYLLLTIPFCFVFYDQAKNKQRAIVFFSSILISFIGTLSTGSRGGVAGLLSLLIMAGCVLSKKKTFLLATLFGIFLISHLHLSFVSNENSLVLDLASFLARSSEVVKRDRFHLWVVPGVPVKYDAISWKRIDENKDIPQSLRARVVLWGQAFETFFESPLLGTGLGQARYSAIPHDSKTFDGAFNIWITLLAETGLLVFIPFCWLVVSFARLSFSLLKQARDREDLLLNAALSSAFVGYLIHSLVEDMIFAIMTNWMFGIILGLMSVQATVKEHRREEEEDIAPNPGLP